MFSLLGWRAILPAMQESSCLPSESLEKSESREEEEWIVKQYLVNKANIYQFK